MEICISLTVLMWLVVEFTSCVPRRRKNENIHNFHTSGVPIAIDNLIQEYEKEYQNFHKEESRKELARCFPRRRKNETIWDFHTTGAAIAPDSLIQEYEKEHHIFYEEIKQDGTLEWQELDKKNLSNYCKKYLYHSVPTRSTSNAFGNKITKTLHYKKENISITHKVFLVHCKVVNKYRILSYYMMRASVPNCVYGLISTRNNKKINFNIINKHCNFEDTPLITRRSLKRPRTEKTISRIHNPTGEPIAKDEYLLQYELEHQDMVKEDKKKNKFSAWPHAILHHNLDYFCYQYMRECAPGRNRESVIGKWKTEKLHYQKVNTIENIYVTVVSCQPRNPIKWRYHFTRAPETNCAYGLRRIGHNLHQPMVIIFKHCDFSDPDDQQAISHQHDIVEQNIFPKTEIKEETSNALETLQFL